MKKMLLAAVAAIATIASASAQTMDGAKDDTPDANAKYAFECTITKVSPPDKDRDPAYKVNVWVNDTQFVRMAHTLVSGAVVYRSEQYGNFGTAPMKTSIEDSPLMWWGRSKKHPEITILGWIGSLNGKLVYKEEIFKGKASPFFGNSKAKAVTTVDSTCHRVEA